MNITELKELFEAKKKNESDINTYSEQLKNKWFFQLISKTRLEWKLQDCYEDLRNINNKFNVGLTAFLINDDRMFSDLVSENKKLITKNDFKLKVYSTSFNLIASTELSFKGYISSKGYLYLFIQKTNIPLLSFQNNLMSTVFVGNYNESGDFYAKSIKKELFNFVPRIPEYYNAKNYSDGTFKMTASKNTWDFSGKEFVDRMIGDPFNESHLDRATYLNNRGKIIAIKDKLINSL